MEELKKKDEEIRRLRNHSKKLLDEVKRLKQEKKNYQIKMKQGSWMENLPKDLKRKFARRLRNP
jgi:hypothetical protein